MLFLLQPLKLQIRRTFPTLRLWSKSMKTRTAINKWKAGHLVPRWLSRSWTEAGLFITTVLQNYLQLYQIFVYTKLITAVVTINDLRSFTVGSVCWKETVTSFNANDTMDTPKRLMFNTHLAVVSWFLYFISGILRRCFSEMLTLFWLRFSHCPPFNAPVLVNLMIDCL